MEEILEKMIEFIKGVDDGAEYSTTEILKETRYKLRRS